jgi:ABC-type multidrug transport system ATPase subunit
MKQAPILILDAITERLDNQVVNELMQCILTLNGRMTIFIIPHN